MTRLAVAALILLAAFPGDIRATPITAAHDDLESTLSNNGSVSGNGLFSRYLFERADAQAETNPRCEEFVRSRSHSPPHHRDLHVRNSNPADDNLVRTHEQLGRTVYNAWLFSPTAQAVNHLIGQHLGDPQPNKDFQWNHRLYVNPPWTVNDRPPTLANGLQDLTQVIPQLRVPPSVRQDTTVIPARPARAVIYPDGPNVGFSMIQDKPWGPRDQHTKRWKYEATCAMYEAIYNILDGVIVLKTIVTPEEALAIMPNPWITKGHAPMGDQWEEMIWSYWSKMHANTPGRLPFKHDPDVHGPMYVFEPRLAITPLSQEFKGFLNYVVLEPQTLAPEATSIIARCLLSRHKDEPPTWDHKEEFFVGHWCFYALLGTKHSDGLASMLAKNKVVGHKILKSVTIFTTGGNAPTLLWSVTDWNQHWGTVKDDLERKWLLLHDEHGKYEYPEVGSSIYVGVASQDTVQG